MLSSLRIENFAIVKQLDLDFASGMTAFTGETGAGKSIMIDALMLALGNRADGSVIRMGEEKCDISAVFQVSIDSEPMQWLTAQDIDSDGEIVLRRVLYAQGRSKSYINGQLFPLQKVKELSQMLVHIHGQHQHQTLMQHATHRQHLDHYANLTDLVNRVQELFKQWQTVKQALTLLHDKHNNQARMDLLQFQIDELSALNLQPDEMQQLNNEHQLLHHAQDYLHHTQHITQLLNGDDNNNINHYLHELLQVLHGLPNNHSNIKNAIELIKNAVIFCEEAQDEVEQFAQHVQLDPEQLQHVEARLSTLHHAARKYHVDANRLAEHNQYLQDELQQLQQAEQQSAILQQQLQTLTQTYHHLAEQLTCARRDHAGKLADDISVIIRQLGMPHGYVTIDVTPLDTIHAHGMDKVEYKVCTNPGMNPDSLHKIASGGELSRISLAIQMITAHRSATPTLFFDEVDVGIGGATAALVGQLLRNLGERLQVFCVTHQAQVASSAHHHFVVAKYSDEKQTFSQMIALKHAEKINEIARMLGGLTITAQTRLHAEELLNQCFEKVIAISQ